MITSKALTEMGLHHYLVVEEQEKQAYEKAIKRFKLTAETLILDPQAKLDYELLDNHGLKKSTGPGPARNFAWEHAKANGAEWHWVMDDNIKCFRRMNNAERIKMITPKFWTIMEDFVLRYKNVAMAGPNYTMFAFGASALPPFVLNTRIYSCNFIRNDLKYRWRGRYNEDTILSLDLLKAGYCTVQFNAFLQEKLGTQVLKGGNTQEFYHKEGKVKEGEKYADTGTVAKSKMLVDVHPDVSKFVWKFSRWHHQVNYAPFKKQKLIRKPNVKIQKGINEYGMVRKETQDVEKTA